MDPNKICFIYCVNQLGLLQESLRHLSALRIPEGMDVEVVTIENAKSMAAGYNEAMDKTDAMYKVYLHQDVHILNPNFIEDALNVFRHHPEVGLLGMIGAAYLPPSGMWWESIDNYGQVYGSHSGTMELLAFGNCASGRDYQPVTAVDGLLIMTQVDIRWREDLFQGWHYYDMSQCMEFIRAGYEVGVPSQDAPWALHDCGVADLTGFEDNRVRFIHEYGPDMRAIFSAYYKRQSTIAANQTPSSNGIDPSRLQSHLQQFGIDVD